MVNNFALCASLSVLAASISGAALAASAPTAFTPRTAATASPQVASTITSGAGPGLITQVYGMKSGAVLFNLSGERTSPPACQGPTIPTRWAIDASTTTGQAMLAVFLSAAAQGRQLGIVGTGECTIEGDTETVNYFEVIDP